MIRWPSSSSAAQKCGPNVVYLEAVGQRHAIHVARPFFGHPTLGDIVLNACWVALFGRPIPASACRDRDDLLPVGELDQPERRQLVKRPVAIAPEMPRRRAGQPAACAERGIL